jgi:hypothetical protein
MELFLLRASLHTALITLWGKSKELVRNLHDIAVAAEISLYARTLVCHLITKRQSLELATRQMFSKSEVTFELWFLVDFHIRVTVNVLFIRV